MSGQPQSRPVEFHRHLPTSCHTSMPTKSAIHTHMLGSWDSTFIYINYAYIHTYIHTYIHYITLHYITLHYITLHYITLHYITLHYITLHYITLHTYIHTYIHTYVRTYVRTYVHTYIHTYIHTYKKTRAHTRPIGCPIQDAIAARRTSSKHTPIQRNTGQSHANKRNPSTCQQHLRTQDSRKGAANQLSTCNLTTCLAPLPHSSSCGAAST